MLSREEFDELEEEEQEELFYEALANVYEKADGNIYEANCTFFIVTENDVWEIPANTDYTPKGGYLETFKGPSKEEFEALASIMSRYGIDEFFFENICDWAEHAEWDTDEAFDNFDDAEADADKIKIIKDLQAYVKTEECPFDSVNDIVVLFPRYELSPDRFYYMWEGEFIDLYDNIAECGETHGTYTEFNAYDWLEVFENLDNYLLREY